MIKHCMSPHKWIESRLIHARHEHMLGTILTWSHSTRSTGIVWCQLVANSVKSTSSVVRMRDMSKARAILVYGTPWAHPSSLLLVLCMRGAYLWLLCHSIFSPLIESYFEALNVIVLLKCCWGGSCYFLNLFCVVWSYSAAFTLKFNIILIKFPFF